MALVEQPDGHWRWEAPGAVAVFTGRRGGTSPPPWDDLNVGLHVGDDATRVLENRRRAAALLDLGPQQVAGVTQVHGADVWLDLHPERELPHVVRWTDAPSPIEADALVSSRTDAALAVGVADCVPIAVCWGDAIGAIHAGWCSLAAGVVEATVAVLRRAAGSSIALQGSQPRAAVGPCLGGCCMQVGEDVAARFGDHAVRRVGPGRVHLDMAADATRRLEQSGFAVEQVAACTLEHPGCFSHRGDRGATGRQALLVRRSG